jgi:hypothetical protein
VAARSAFLVLGLALLPATAMAGTQDTGATAVVAQFYDWYLAQHGDVDWYPPQKGHVDWRAAWEHHSPKYYRARPFFHPELFDLLDETYFKAIGDDAPPIDVSTTAAHDAAHMSGFDPFSGAASAATSYRLGSPWIGKVMVGMPGGPELRDVTFVPVTLAFAGAKPTSRVSVIVRKTGASYQIYNIHYGAIPFYYAGQIVDLQRFLGAYNC